jgi:hypothetical protein
MPGSGALQFAGNRIYANRPFGQLHPPPPSIFDDFLIDVLADDPYVTVTQSGTAITAAAVSATAGDPVAGHGGWIAGATDDVDAEIDEVSVGGLGTGAGTPWLRADQVGTGVLVCEWGITIPTALTARQYFAGLSDDPVEGTATNGPLNIQSTTTIVDVAADAAGWIFSSLASTPTVWKFGATDSGTQDTATDGLTGSADTWRGMRVEVDVNGDCYFSTRATRGGTLTFWGKSANGLSPDVLLVPVFTAAPTTTTAVSWEIDYCFATSAPV